MSQPIFDPAKRLQISARSRRRNMVSLTPLIDVVFILLVFFMLASSFLDWHALDLNAPGKTARSAPTMEQSLLVEIDDQGIRIAGERLGLDDIGRPVGAFLSTGRGSTIFLKPDDGIPLQKTIEVLDALKAAGAPNVSLIRGRGQ